MDETMKVYMPRKQWGETIPITARPKYAEFIVPDEPAKANEAKPIIHKSKWKRFCDYIFDGETWKNVFNTNGKREYDLEQKYPWFEILYRWTIALLIFLLCISFVIWGVNIYTEHTAQAYGQTVAEQKDAEHLAYIAQQEADRKAAEQSLEKLMQKNATAKAKAAYGSHAFQENRNYGEADFMTFCQCVDNRLKNPMYAGMTIEQIVFQEGQFLSSYETNPLQDYYYNIAMKSERLKHEREVNNLPEPVGSDYVYLVYTDHGLFLTNDPKAPAYTWWRYSE